MQGTNARQGKGQDLMLTAEGEASPRQSLQMGEGLQCPLGTRTACSLLSRGNTGPCSVCESQRWIGLHFFSVKPIQIFSEPGHECLHPPAQCSSRQRLIQEEVALPSVVCPQPSTPPSYPRTICKPSPTATNVPLSPMPDLTVASTKGCLRSR